MHPYGQLFLVLRVITMVYGIVLVLEFAGKAVTLYVRSAAQ